MLPAHYQYKLKLGQYQLFLSKPKVEMFQLKQTHSTKVIEARPSSNLTNTEGDGIYFFYDNFNLQKNITLAIQTADCLPIIVMGKKGGAILHAGWRGVAGKIALTPEVQSINPEIFYIGPHIGSCCFEVQTDFHANFPNSKNFFKRQNKEYFDLTHEMIQQLQSVYDPRQVQIIYSHHCTHCSPLGLHSFRREKGPQRNWNVWQLTLS